MIPKENGSLFSRVILFAVAQEVRQRGGIAHAGGGQLIHQGKPLAIIHIALQNISIDDIVLPGLGAAGLDDDPDILRQGHLHHFHQVAGGKAAVRFQVAAAQVPVDGPGAGLSVGFGRRDIFSTRTKGQHQKECQQRAQYSFFQGQFLHVDWVQKDNCDKSTLFNCLHCSMEKQVEMAQVRNAKKSV